MQPFSALCIALVIMESIFAVAAALIVLFTAIMDQYISVVIAVTLLVALGIYEFVRKQKKEYLNG